MRVYSGEYYNYFSFWSGIANSVIDVIFKINTSISIDYWSGKKITIINAMKGGNYEVWAVYVKSKY